MAWLRRGCSTAGVVAVALGGLGLGQPGAGLRPRQTLAEQGGDPRRAGFREWDANWDLMAGTTRLRKEAMEARKAEEDAGATRAAKDAAAAAAPADAAAGKEVAQNKPARTRRPCRYLFLVRHGQYNYVSRAAFPGISEEARLRWDEANALTELGHEQARRTGSRLAEIAASAGFRFDAVYHSDQMRATETAVHIQAALAEASRTAVPLHVDQMLREGNPIEPEPASSVYRPSERSCQEDGARIEAAFRRYFHRPVAEQESDSHEVLVCHGNVIRYFTCRALQVDPAAWLRLSVYNCGITVVRITSSGGVSVSNLGDTGHLPAEMVTYS